MKSISGALVSIVRSGDVAFVAVVVVAYISAVATIGYAPRHFTAFGLTLLIGSGLAYLVAGTWGFARCKTERRWVPFYFPVQMVLAATTIYLLPSGAIFLIALPLAGQGVVLLSRPWMLAVCVVILAMMVAPIWWRGGIVPAAIVALIFVGGLVFVVVFTQIAVDERNARKEVERLLSELSEANRKLREYATQVEELATTQERNRLAREIHDSLGHYLTVINIQMEAARAVIDDRRRVLEVLGKAQTLAQDGLTEIRRSVAALRSSPTENRPLREILSSLVGECRSAGIAAELHVQGAARLLAPQIELTLYRSAQEGLTNVRKHARASRATVTLDYSKVGVVRLVVEDDGVGGDSGGGGFGLLGVQERAELIGGNARIRSNENGGFTLEVELHE
ncbi:MAG TPA: histidine kinase [Blastocatellia bacterium]|nr:histidine kinase [Blastocatellia bacterium]